VNDDCAAVGMCGECQTGIPARAANSWFPLGGKWKTCHPQTGWMQTVKQDVSRGGSSWNDLSTLTADRKRSKELTALHVSLTWKRYKV